MKEFDMKALVDKFNELMDAAEEFGNQSKQLSHVRSSFDEYMKSVMNSNDQMQQLLSLCDSYLRNVNNLVESEWQRGIEQQIKELDTQTKNICSEMKDAYDHSFSKIDSAINFFNNHPKQFESILYKTQENLVRNTNQVRESVNNLLKEFDEKRGEILDKAKADILSRLEEQNQKLEQNFSTISEKITALDNCINEKKDYVITQVNQYLEDKVNNVEGEIERQSTAVKEKMDTQGIAFSEFREKCIDMLNEINRQEVEINNIKMQQLKNHTMIIVAAVCSGVSALVAVIGLVL